MKDCLRKKGLDVKQARRMVQNKSEWRGLCGGIQWVRCQQCGLTYLYEGLGWNSCSWPALQLKGHKEENFFLKLCCSSTVAHFIA